MKPGGAKRKGANFERHVADVINAKFGGDCRRTPMSGAIHDIADFRGDIMLLPPELKDFLIECKHQERIELWRFLEQAEREAQGKKIPLLVFTKNNKDDYVCLKFHTLLELLWNINRLEKELVAHEVYRGT